MEKYKLKTAKNIEFSEKSFLFSSYFRSHHLEPSEPLDITPPTSDPYPRTS